MFSSVAVAVTPSNMFNSAAVDVTPSRIFNSAVVDVTPSKIFTSVAVAVIATSSFSFGEVNLLFVRVCVISTATKSCVPVSSLSGNLKVFAAAAE